LANKNKAIVERAGILKWWITNSLGQKRFFALWASKDKGPLRYKTKDRCAQGLNPSSKCLDSLKQFLILNS
jgi:hypothetical protein